MKITIAGELGSGKSTVAKMLAEMLDYKHYSIGDFMRDIADERGVTFFELNNIAKKSNEVDEKLDTRQVILGEKEDDFVLDARLGWYFIPDSIKIYLSVDIDEAAKRIFTQKRDSEKENTTLEDTKKNMIYRRESEEKRYHEYYGLENTSDEFNYDLVLDTTDFPPETIVMEILQFVKTFN